MRRPAAQDRGKTDTKQRKLGRPAAGLIAVEDKEKPLPYGTLPYGT